MSSAEQKRKPGRPKGSFRGHGWSQRRQAAAPIVADLSTKSLAWTNSRTPGSRPGLGFVKAESKDMHMHMHTKRYSRTIYQS